MRRLATYAVVFLAGFMAFLVAFAPAATIWQFARADVQKRLPNLQVLSVDGTIWSGSANIRYWNFPPTDVRWSIAPLSLLHARLDLKTVASGDYIHLETNARIARDRIDALTDGYVESPWINPVSTNYGLKYSGRLTVDSLALVSDFRWFSKAAGKLHWNGGQVVYQTARGPQGIQLPAMDGTLHEDGGNLNLDITQAARTLIAITLRRTGWVKVDIKAGLMEAANLPWPPGESRGDTALMLEEQLFPAR